VDRAATHDILERIAEIERAVDADRYTPGAWAALQHDVRRLPRAQRAALADRLSRISRKLHSRGARQIVPFAAGVAMECGLAIAGGGLLFAALRWRSNILGALAVIAWVTAFQPLVKVLCGLALGIRYDYAYLAGGEPRFKSRFGTYLAAPRAVRILFHLAGTIGSPLGAWLATRWLDPGLGATRELAWVLFGVLATLNAAILILALAGVSGIGPLRLSLASAGAAASEMREGG
jgi:hypothetical protein